MIRRYNDWQRINEVDELTEVKLTGKYINNIIQSYEKYPSKRPSRETKDFVNAAKTQSLATFMKSVSGKKSSEILIDVMNNWYQWPGDSKSKAVLFDYINNSDDLSNLAGLGTPFGKVLKQDPSLGYGFGFGKYAAKGAAKLGKGLFGWVPKLLKLGESARPLNEAAAAVAGAIAIQTLLSAGLKYSLYGKESIEDDILVSWATPYLPDIKGLVGDDPIITTYVTVFNTMMMIVYDAWNLSMGQDKYGEHDNPIIDWQNGNNYITSYYKQFYESDADIKSNFVTFMNKLKDACLDDMKHPEKFRETPFYYTGDKVRVDFGNNNIQTIELSEWYKWVRDNHKKYKLTPITRTEFKATERKSGFKPLLPLGIDEIAKGDPTRIITVEFPNGSISKPSLLELEVFLESLDDPSVYSIESQNIIGGGSSLILVPGGDKEEVDEEITIPTESPAIVKNSSRDQILSSLRNESIVSFAGMGDV